MQFGTYPCPDASLILQKGKGRRQKKAFATLHSQSTGKTERYADVEVRFAAKQFLDRSSSSNSLNLSNEKYPSDNWGQFLIPKIRHAKPKNLSFLRSIISAFLCLSHPLVGKHMVLRYWLDSNLFVIFVYTLKMDCCNPC